MNTEKKKHFTRKSCDMMWSVMFLSIILCGCALASKRSLPQRDDTPRVSQFEAVFEQELSFRGCFDLTLQGYDSYTVRYTDVGAKVSRRWKALLERNEQGYFSLEKLEETPTQYEPEYGLGGIFLKALFPEKGQPPRLVSFQVLEPNNLASAVTAWSAFFSSKPSKGVTRDNQQLVYSPYAPSFDDDKRVTRYDFKFTNSEEDWLAALSLMMTEFGFRKVKGDNNDEVEVLGTMATVKNRKPLIKRRNKGALDLNISERLKFQIGYRIGWKTGGEIDREGTDIIYDPHGEFLREAKMTLVCDEADWDKFIVPVRERAVEYKLKLDESPSFKIRFHMWPSPSQRMDDEKADEAQVACARLNSGETYKLCCFTLNGSRKRFLLMHDKENVPLVSEVVDVKLSDENTTVWENADSSFCVTCREDSYKLEWPKNKNEKPTIVLDAAD